MKYLFFDYDGTLAYEGVVSDKNKKALADAKARGHKIFLNTGRSKENIPASVLREIDWDGIVAGSGYGEYEGKPFFEKYLDPAQLWHIYNYAEKRGVRVLFEGVNELYINEENPEVEHIKFHLPFNESMRITNATVNAPMRDEDEEYFKDFKTVRLPNYFEITTKGIGKHTAISVLEEKLAIPHSDIVVFGDSENDLDMLKYAETAIIMNHAPDFLSEFASLRTASDENGVAEGIEWLIG